jgi:hypothetical protein
MVNVKLSAEEADRAFPFNMELEQPTGEAVAEVINSAWAAADARYGPFPVIREWQNWAIADSFAEVAFRDDDGDTVIKAAEATACFVDGSRERVVFVCTAE